MGAADFRVGGRIFATLASEDKGYGSLMLTPELQAQFVEDLPEVFLPIPGGWGRMGSTHIRLAKANEDVLTGALRTVWKLRVEKNKGRRRKALHGAAECGGSRPLSLQSVASRGERSCTIFPNDTAGESFGNPLDWGRVDCVGNGSISCR